MRRVLTGFLLAMLLAMSGAALWAQGDDVGDAFKRPDAQEQQRLRDLLATPIDATLSSQAIQAELVARRRAVDILGDDVLREHWLREAVRLRPFDPWAKWVLGIHLFTLGQRDEGIGFVQQAVSSSMDPYARVFMASQIACLHVWQGEISAAQASADSVAAAIQAVEAKARTSRDVQYLTRAMSRNASCVSQIEMRAGHFANALKAQEKSEFQLRKALATLADAGALDTSDGIGAQTDLADGLIAKVHLYEALGRLTDAENAMVDLLHYTSEVQLKRHQLGASYLAASQLRFAQREFVQAEDLARKADDAYARMGREPTHGSRLELIRDVVSALVGQKRWDAALHEFERVDGLSRTDPNTKRNVRFNFERALTYFGNRRYDEASALFAEVERDNRSKFGETNFFTAEARGLQGAALWRSGLAENRARALPLLKNAVRDYMDPANADCQENIGIRRELREMVFSAYLDAMASFPGENPLDAIGPADWFHGGVVQEALNDAAVRAAVNSESLSAVVRRDQDAKNEISALRHFLSGGVGAVRSPLPDVAAKMRERIAELERERAQLRAEIRARFPDYDQLVRPRPPTVRELASLLSPQQALLMLLPTTDAVYVWAMAADRPSMFYRAAVTEAEVSASVQRLRNQLDLDAGPQAGRQFDDKAAFDLYNKLLAPLAPVWSGKAQLIVAAGGALSQLPFAVLRTNPLGGNGLSAPWLIRDVSITQAPSLSAWVAMGALRRRSSADQAFLGWGDPSFGGQRAKAPESNRLSRKVALDRPAVQGKLDAPEALSVRSGVQYSAIPALPDTRDELISIARELHADVDNDVLLGNKATRASVLGANQSGQLAAKRVLVFATHGLMAGDLPNLTQPALALAANDLATDDSLSPLLTLEDVLGLRLNADWVVLSACNTAAAEGRAGEALSGLARGFFYAGARSLLVTQWAVESESAKRLTTATFRHYVANPASPKAESLRQAMLEVMAVPKYSHPAFWAPYTLVGDGGR